MNELQSDVMSEVVPGLAQVGDQSDWVTAIGRTLAEVGPQLGSSLPEHHWAFLCDKLGESHDKFEKPNPNPPNLHASMHRGSRCSPHCFSHRTCLENRNFKEKSAEIGKEMASTRLHPVRYTSTTAKH